MKFERINETRIKCTITKSDLSDRNIELSELAYGSDKAKLLFREMMQQARYELNFDAEDQPLMIEAVPKANGELTLIITKVDYPEELDTRFSDFTAPGSDYAPDGAAFPGLPKSADDILDMFKSAEISENSDENQSPAKSRFEEILEKAAKNTDAELPESQKSEDSKLPADSDFTKIYSFRSLTDVIRLAKAVSSFYNGDNTLYVQQLDRSYYLVLHKSAHTPEEFNRVCNILSEYALSDKFADVTMGFFREHCRTVIEGCALNELAKY